jgi:hypothetical protein
VENKDDAVEAAMGKSSYILKKTQQNLKVLDVI